MPVRAINSARSRMVFQLARRLQARAVMGCTRVLRWHELGRQRRTLLTLDDRMLKDIGISRGDAEREARRPFWSDGANPHSEPHHARAADNPWIG